MRKFIYKNLVDLGFKRYTLGDGFDIQGFEDFYLHFKVNKLIEFEWYPLEYNEVRMVRYDKENIKNVIIIQDMDSLKMMLNFFTNDEGNRGNKPKLSKKESSNDLEGIEAFCKAC